jgi:hypothetical protein
MGTVRKIVGWLVLASYLLANSVAPLWHDHHEHGCCQAATCQPSQCPAVQAGHKNQHHHKHHHHHGSTCHEHQSGHGADQPVDEGPAGPTPHHHCVVCEFQSLAPLTTAAPVLIDAGEVVQIEVALPVARLCAAPPKSHPARGPPAAV